jgi:hypothetical protein
VQLSSLYYLDVYAMKRSSLKTRERVNLGQKKFYEIDAWFLHLKTFSSSLTIGQTKLVCLPTEKRQANLIIAIKSRAYPETLRFSMLKNIR